MDVLIAIGHATFSIYQVVCLKVNKFTHDDTLIGFLSKNKADRAFQISSKVTDVLYTTPNESKTLKPDFNAIIFWHVYKFIIRSHNFPHRKTCLEVLP